MTVKNVTKSTVHGVRNLELSDLIQKSSMTTSAKSFTEIQCNYDNKRVDKRSVTASRSEIRAAVVRGAKSLHKLVTEKRSRPISFVRHLTTNKSNIGK